MKKLLYLFLIPATLLVITLMIRIVKSQVYYVDWNPSSACPEVSVLHTLPTTPPKGYQLSDSNFIQINCVNSEWYATFFWATILSALIDWIVFFACDAVVIYRKKIAHTSTSKRVVYDVGAAVLFSLSLLAFVAACYVAWFFAQ
jgi:hypothetical protein